jgi:hypothetical protein
MLRSANRLATMLAILLLGVAGPVLAQDSTVAPKPPIITIPEKEFLLPDGTEISVKTVGELSGKTAAVGDVFTWRVAKPVIINNFVVIPEGAPVKGSVTEAKAAGMMGKSGKLNIRLDVTKTTDGQSVKLRTTQAKSGDSRTGTTVALVLLFGPLGLWKHGTEGIIKDGTVFPVFVDEDIKVVVKPE